MKILKSIFYVIILILLIGGVIGSIYFYCKYKGKIKEVVASEMVIKDTKIYVKVLEKTINDFKNNPPITITKFITLPDKEKDKAYNDLLEIDKKKDIIIESNKNKLIEVNNELEKMTNLAKKVNHKNDFIGIVEGGFDQTFHPDLAVGAMYLRKVIATPILDFKLGIGGVVKFYDTRGGRLILAIGGSW
jgi:hypothetical protein